MNTRLSDLLFLSGLAAFATTGCDTSDDDSDSAASATDGASTSSAGTDGSTSDGGGGSTNTPSGTSDDPTAGNTTTGDASACAAYTTKAVECDPDQYDYDTQLSYCTELRATIEMYYGADCVAAYDEVLVCATTLDCEAFNDDSGNGCQAAQDAFEETCNIPVGGSSGGAGGSTSGG